jgi:hypothetical protein
MPDFNTTRAQLNEVTLEIEQEQRALSLAREQLKLLALEKARVVRSRGSDSDAHQAVTAKEQAAERAIAKSKKVLEGLKAAKGRVLVDFEAFADPRKQVGELPNDAPILLFPVRLETRFKKITVPGAAVRHQLWVRIFPDECSIDTFDEVLSQSEIVRARHHWTARWEAGRAGHPDVESQVRDLNLGAWRELMGVFNAGRAYWITEHYVPLNEADLPVRLAATDRLFVIPTDEPPPTATAAALVAYWEAAFKARGARAATEAAFAALATALGGDQAAAQAAITAYSPRGFAPAPDDGSPLPRVHVAFQTFAKNADVKLNAWSQAAKVRTFPERFVLLGFQDNSAPPVLNVLGNAVPDPLIVGPDTSDDIDELLEQAFPGEIAGLSDEQKSAKYVEYLAQHSDTAWLFDFERAIASGLGFKVDLTADQYSRGFTRLMVLGVKIGADAAVGQKTLEQLLRNHQFGDAGLSLVPQGAPTNNTEEGGSARSLWEDPAEAYARYHEPSSEPDPMVPAEKRDGRHLADWLGVDPEAAGLPTAQHYYGRDQLEARAMHIALWNATLGYFLESMVAPLATEHQRNVVRKHMIEQVRGRGTVPAIRIGKQPYGILPIADLRNVDWLARPIPGVDSDDLPTLRTLYEGFRVMRSDLEAGVLNQVAHVGGSGDAHEILLRMIGLQPGSVEFDRRLAESFASIKNALYMQGVLGDEIDNLDQVYRAEGMALLEHLGYTPSAKSEPLLILDRSFLGKQQDVEKPPVDDTPLSEDRAVCAYTAAGENYLEWLIRGAKEDHQLIRDQKGFVDDKRPIAILYDLLVHAMNLGFADASLDLHRIADVITASDVRDMRRDEEFIAVKADHALLESKWDLIYRKEPKISAAATVADHISAQLKLPVGGAGTHQLKEVIQALELLKRAPTARLERCLTEHLDCCHYRLDAWLLSFLRLRLAALRSSGEGDSGEPRRGVYLGAYGWVEDLKADDRELTLATLDDVQRGVFDPQNKGDIATDSSNAGYIHALSVGHGVTAAVLRNAYISAASPEDVERYKINLSSERVRAALAILEGMQQGQSLAELLGYELERGLHDNNGEELDVFIYELRKAFPLAANRMKRTLIKKGRVPKNALESIRFAEEEAELDGDRAVSKVEARNVVNGLSLLERVKEPGHGSYPFGFPTGAGLGQMRAATAGQRAAIDAEVRRIVSIEDAVADLALAEGVHQVVQGNYERAAGALDAYSKGGFPPQPEVVQSPASGLALTHRFGIHLQPGILPDAGVTPRSKAEPAVNAWLKDLFPASNLIGCNVRFRAPAAEGQPPNAWSDFPVTLQDLQLEPIDMLYMHDQSSEKNLGALDDRVLQRFQTAAPRRADIEIAIDYTSATVATGLTFFELGAMLRELRALVVASRPLEASDLTLQTAGSKTQNVSAAIHPDRISKAKAVLDVALAGLKTAYIDAFAPLIDFEDPAMGRGNFASIRNLMDDRTTQLVQRLGTLSLFGMQGAASSAVYERRRDVHAALRGKVAAFADRWADYDVRYTDLITVQLPAALDDEKRIAILHEAEALISASATTTFANVGALQAAVALKKSDFDTKRAEITAFLGTSPLTYLAAFNAAADLIAGMEVFDLQPLAITEEQNLLVTLAEDLLKQAQALHAAGTAQSTTAGERLTFATTADPVEQLKAMQEAAVALFGEGFKVLPEFALGAEQALELAQCAGAVSQLLAHQKTKTDFPVDDWLYGVARVREKLGAWENLAVLAEAFKERPSFELTPMQLPFRENDTWLALGYPDTHIPTGDNLLYSAFAPGFDPSQPQVGLLVDEWTETIPNPQETTALTFHYDRPNCEPPQSLLLVTPSALTARWSWQEVVAALHEALALARVRALEPDLLDQTDYARFLPTTVATLTVHPVTIALDYASKAFTMAVAIDG